MRFQRSRDGSRTAGNIDGDFPFQIDTSEIVVILFGNFEAIADEDSGRVHGSGIGSWTEEAIVAEREWDGFAVVHDFERGVGLIELEDVEFYSLREAVFT